ncbi:hypothetical protein ACWDZ4_11050 [Streptomyces sp. NPDC003016]
MTPLPARRGETQDGGRSLVIFVDEAAACLGELRPLVLQFPARLVPRDFPNEMKEDW